MDATLQDRASAGIEKPFGQSNGSVAAMLAVVVPFYNESESIPRLIERIGNLAKDLASAPEVILVDDGSTDGTAELLERLTSNWSRTTVLRLPANRGQAGALLAGLERVTAPLVATMDGDGQNDPGDIPALMRFLEQSGGDMVVGVRASRKDSGLRRGMSRLANGVRSRMLGDGVSDSGCALKVFRREVIGSFLPIRTLYSFMPAMAVAAGFRVVEMPVRHHPREGGVSSYGLRSMLWRPLVDLLGMWWFVRRRVSPVSPEAKS